MSKTKLRCMTCGKWFQSANAREVTCPDCTQKARKEKQAQKNAPTTATKAGPGTPTVAARPAPPPKPKATAGGTIQWLDKVADIKIAQPEEPVAKPKAPNPPVHRETANGTGGNRNGERGGDGQRGRSPAAYREGNTTGGSTPTIGQRPQTPRQPMGAPANGTGRPLQKEGNEGGPRPQQGGAKPRGKPKARVNAPPKPKKEKTPPPAPFVPTAEQIKQVEERYTVLAQPAEFDGIRTQIAKEFNIPKKAVKKIIKDFRGQEHIPSWWELQTYKGSSEELEKIKAVYQPYLPVPPVGVHKKIADTLALKPGIVYQAIKSIRQEMELPQYNNPDLHEEELKQKAAEKQAQDNEKAARKQAEDSEKASELKQEVSEQEGSTVTDTADAISQEQATTAVEVKSADKHELQPEQQELKEDATVQE